MLAKTYSLPTHKVNLLPFVASWVFELLDPPKNYQNILCVYLTFQIIFIGIIFFLKIKKIIELSTGPGRVCAIQLFYISQLLFNIRIIVNIFVTFNGFSLEDSKIKFSIGFKLSTLNFVEINGKSFVMTVAVVWIGNLTLKKIKFFCVASSSPIFI